MIIWTLSSDYDVSFSIIITTKIAVVITTRATIGFGGIAITTIASSLASLKLYAIVESAS